jgi:hypothetical protein
MKYNKNLMDNIINLQLKNLDDLIAKTKKCKIEITKLKDQICDSKSVLSALQTNEEYQKTETKLQELEEYVIIFTEGVCCICMGECNPESQFCRRCARRIY